MSSVLSWALFAFVVIFAVGTEPQGYYSEAMRDVVRDDYVSLQHRIIDNREILYQTNENGLNILHYAVVFERIECIDCILRLSRGVNINAQDKAGLTPLHYAVTHSKEIVEMLLRHNADTKIRCNAGFTPVDLCVDPEIQELFKGES